jgi:hypothetical protein
LVYDILLISKGWSYFLDIFNSILIGISG